MLSLHSPVAVRFLLVLLVASLGGCSGAYERLASEDQSPEHFALKQAAERLDRRTHRVKVEIGGGQTIRMAVHESGPQDAPRTIVLIHGVLSDSRMWRFVEPDLAREHRVIAVDLPGCGQSDKPEPSRVPADFYGPCSLARCVLLALRQRPGFSGGEAAQITFISHSLGGMVVHRMFCNDMNRAEFADLLVRVDTVIAFAPPHVDIERVPAAFEAVARASDLEFAIADATGILRQRVAEAALLGAPDPSLMFREEADRLVEILKDPRTRRAAKASLRAAVPNDGRRPDSIRAREIAAGYARMTVPTLIVWGADDDTLGCSMGHKLKDHLPNACLRLVTHARHSVPIERPAVSLGLIRTFLSRGQRVAELQVPVATIDGRSGLPRPSQSGAVAIN